MLCWVDVEPEAQQKEILVLLLLLFSLFHVFPSLLIFPIFFLSDFPARKVIHEKTSSRQVSFFVLCFMHVYYYYDYYYFDGRSI